MCVQESLWIRKLIHEMFLLHLYCLSNTVHYLPCDMVIRVSVYSAYTCTCLAKQAWVGNKRVAMGWRPLNCDHCLWQWLQFEWAMLGEGILNIFVVCSGMQLLYPHGWWIIVSHVKFCWSTEIGRICHSPIVSEFRNNCSQSTCRYIMCSGSEVNYHEVTTACG